MAVKKYYDTKIVEKKHEAMEKLIKDHLIPFYNKIEPHSWRHEKYFNEKMDNLIDTHLAIFKDLYRIFSTFKLSSESFAISISDFINVFNSCGLVNEGFNMRNAGYIFA
jgi:hypothetical protein